ncbi:MAG TPA: hypothetical protein VHI52_07535 [Verrucomicrobiae bacterium]|nr:hypothetical protein [Verrucomicrobiae bacterium]
MCWQFLMIEVLLFHLLAITAGASFSLVAIWAAVGRSPWFLRFAVAAAVISCLIPVPALDVAAGAASQALVVAISLWVIRFKVAPAAKADPGPAGHWRFSMSSLLRATLLIASVFAVAAYMPADERRSWWKYAVTGAGFGAATLTGAWAGSSQRRLWVRWGILWVVAPLAGGRWWGATLGVGFLVAAWICLARRSGLLLAPLVAASPTAIGTSKAQSLIVRPPLARAALSSLTLAMVFLPISAYHDMLQAVPIPVEPLPEPNAYDEVLRIAKLLVSGTSSSALEPKVSPEQRRSALFEQLDAACRQPSAVPIRYELGYTNLDAIQALRQLSRSLHAEATQQRLAEKTSDARKAYQDLVELGLVTARGGFIVDRLVGTALTDMGIEGLRQILDELSFDERRALIAALQANETAWEPLGKVHARDCAAVDKTVGWLSRITFAFPSDFRSGTRAAEQADRRRLAKIRLLVCHLAIAQYQTDHGRPPGVLTDLVPAFYEKSVVVNWLRWNYPRFAHASIRASRPGR